MKKLIYILICIALCMSCKKEKDPPTTYQIVNNCTVDQTGYTYLDGSMYQVTIFHYSGTDVVKQDNITKVASGGGKSELKDAPANSQKIKVSFKLLPPESPYYSLDLNHWITIVAVTTIVKGQNNIVTLDDHTIISQGLASITIKSDLIKALDKLNIPSVK